MLILVDLCLIYHAYTVFDLFLFLELKSAIILFSYASLIVVLNELPAKWNHATFDCLSLL